MIYVKRNIGIGDLGYLCLHQKDDLAANIKGILMTQVQGEKGTLTWESSSRLATISSPGNYYRKGLLIMVR